MKLLHREDVIEAGYDLPNTGLCANIGQAELEELKFGGEWVLAQDETVVADGHEQRYLYMLVAGDVAISKKNDQGNSQPRPLSYARQSVKHSCGRREVVSHFGPSPP